jgi:hypothetical protein
LSVTAAEIAGNDDDSTVQHAAATSQTEWQYVVPDPGGPMEHPPFQAVALTTEKPDDLREAIDYRGIKQWYGQLRYGTPSSTRVAVVVDELDGREFDLYVDLNRNRSIDGKERIDGGGETRRVAITTEVSQDGVAEHFARSVIFRRGTTGRALGYATAGYVEGAVRIGDRHVPVRRVDGDGNGLFADSRDRVWFDLNADRQWDEFAEQFPLTPIIVLGDQRFAIRSDPTGSRMTVEEIVGVGRIRLEVKPAQAQARILSLDVTLVGDDGSAFAVRNAEQAAAVPVGRYALGSVTLSMEHPQTKMPWHFIFSRSGRPAADQWFPVAKDEEVVADAIGTLRFVLESRDLAGGVAAGETLAISPRLYTGHGLLINSTRCGRSLDAAYDNGSCASVVLRATDGTALAAAKSGFS